MLHPQFKKPASPVFVGGEFTLTRAVYTYLNMLRLADTEINITLRLQKHS
jgi:hypothetical protein